MRASPSSPRQSFSSVCSENRSSFPRTSPEQWRRCLPEPGSKVAPDEVRLKRRLCRNVGQNSLTGHSLAAAGSSLPTLLVIGGAGGCVTRRTFAMSSPVRDNPLRIHQLTFAVNFRVFDHNKNMAASTRLPKENTSMTEPIQPALSQHPTPQVAQRALRDSRLTGPLNAYPPPLKIFFFATDFLQVILFPVKHADWRHHSSRTAIRMFFLASLATRSGRPARPTPAPRSKRLGAPDPDFRTWDCGTGNRLLQNHLLRDQETGAMFANPAQARMPLPLLFAGCRLPISFLAYIVPRQARAPQLHSASSSPPS